LGLDSVIPAAINSKPIAGGYEQEGCVSNGKSTNL
jgi:hypothetical protein